MDSGATRQCNESSYQKIAQPSNEAYWGRIVNANEATDVNSSTQSKAAHTLATSTESAGDLYEHKTVEINSSVLDGWGLEPSPVARFAMTEETQEYDDEGEDIDDDDDDDDEEMFRQSLGNNADFGGDGGRNGDDTDDDDDPFSSADAFQ